LPLPSAIASSLIYFHTRKTLVEKLRYAMQYFHFGQNFEITIFAKIFKYVSKLLKDSMFMVEIFLHLSREILTNLSVPQH